MSSTDPMTGMTILEAVDCWKRARGRCRTARGEHRRPPGHLPDQPHRQRRRRDVPLPSGNQLANGGARAIGCVRDRQRLARGPVARGASWSKNAVELDEYADLDAAEKLPLFSWAAFPKPHWVRIEPDEITGRRFHVVN